MIELWGDFQCSETKEAFTRQVLPLLKRAEQRRAVVTAFYRPFPLPYLRNAFASACAAAAATHLLTEQNVPNAFLHVATTLFAAQHRFLNAPTQNKTRSEINELFVDILGVTLSDRVRFRELMDSDEIRSMVTTSWKYGCSRGVSGAPVYAVNRVVSDAVFGWGAAEWEGLLGGVERRSGGGGGGGGGGGAGFPTVFVVVSLVGGVLLLRRMSAPAGLVLLVVWCLTGVVLRSAAPEYIF